MPRLQQVREPTERLDHLAEVEVSHHDANLMKAVDVDTRLGERLGEANHLFVVSLLLRVLEEGRDRAVVQRGYAVAREALDAAELAVVVPKAEE